MSEAADRRRVIEQFRDAFRWSGDKHDDALYADLTSWWRGPGLFGRLGPLLAELATEPPTVVLAIESRGFLPGAAVALHLGVGLVEVRKNPRSDVDSDAWVQQTTGPDYRDRNLRLGIRRRLLESGDRVLLVDDWVDTGSQAIAAKRIVERTGATWVGMAAIVDGLEDSATRRALNLRSLLHIRDLG
jgi:adenine phosphoribosyltransferase